MSTKQAALQWGISERRVRILCSEGRVDGVQRSGWAWNIPLDASKPTDGRQLRHLKNVDLRIGTMNFSSLEEIKQAFLTEPKEEQQMLLIFRNSIFRFVLGTFACEDLVMGNEDLALLYSGCFSPSVSFDAQILALNVRSLLLRFVQDSGLGPGYRKARPTPYFTEGRLVQLYRSLLQGIDDEAGLLYRELDPTEVQQEPDLPVATRMEILLRQYEMDWKTLHPLVRSLFLFGELLRIRPFGRYDVVFAFLALAGELLASGFPPAFVGVEQVNEFKASLVLTRTRGNYQHTVRMLESSLRHEIALYSRKESLL
ncbi:MAG: hypothetical protein RBR15_07255 [Sphaerochaeta sp.]|nr:hypothetical protein [Sphaerochaeta sp.]